MERYNITYELYKNDYNRKTNLKRGANTLAEISDWLMDFASPPRKDRRHLHMGITRFGDIRRIEAFDYDRQEDLWIHQIELDGMIVFSDGKYTNGVSFVTEEVRDWCKATEELYRTPKNNFAPLTYRE